MSYPVISEPLDFRQAVKSALSQYVGFSGRARRSEYWYFYLLTSALSIAATIVDVLIGSLIPDLVVSALFWLPGLAVSCRRLHDTGRSAWSLLYGLIPLAGWIVLFVFFCRDSQPGSNKYGPSSKYLSTSDREAPPPPNVAVPAAGPAPWIAAGGLGVLVALLVLVLVHVNSVSDNHAKAGGSGYGLTAEQEQAVTAASTEAVNVVTFSRKTFNADFARALNGATGSLKSDLAKEKTLTLNTMTSGKYDLKGTVGSSAYAGTTDNGKGLLVLVTVNGFKVSDSAGEGSATVQRLELTMVKSGNKWLADDLTATGIE